MRTIRLLLILAVCQINFSYGQNNSSNIVFALVMPNEIEGFDDNHLVKLESKIIQATTNYGIAGKGFYSDFVIYPVVSTNEIQNTEGMKNLISYSIELGIFIKSISDGKIYASYSKSFIGIGGNEKLALTNALNDIDPYSKDFTNFFLNASGKIISYFDTKCDDILSKADALSKMGAYEEALALLSSIPNISAVCYNKVKSKSIEVYKLFLNKNCQTLLLTASSYHANKNTDKALEYICLIDPTSKCFEEAKTLLKNIVNDLNEKEKEEINFKMKVYEDEYEMEKLKLAAIKDIAVAYYSQKPTSYNYNEIVIIK